MKYQTLVGLALSAAALAFSSSAQAAITLDSTHCTSVKVSDGGCRFLGVNLANTAQSAEVQELYNSYSPALPLSPIDLTKLLGTNNGAGFGVVTFDDATKKIGDWKTAGYTIDYLAVSGGNQTILYYVGGISEGEWSTQFLKNNGGNQPALSHLAFYGSVTAVPEPASWAMLIAGLGAVGFTMRRRKSAVSFA